MDLSPVARTRLATAASAGLAVALGVLVAEEAYLLPLLCAAALATLVTVRWLPLPSGTVLLGALLAGYLIGNRGFAQISLLGGLPLLPGEAGLLAGFGLLAWHCARRRELPLRRDPLDLALLAWLIVGGIRVCFDVRLHGFLAIRDFAMVYYAGYFYLAQAAAREAADRRFLHGTLLIGLGLLLPVYWLFGVAPEFFVQTLTLRGAPLIFFKDDLAGTFIAVGAVLFFLRRQAGGSRWNSVASLVFAAATLAGANRASMLGLFAAAAWLAVRRQWRFAALLATGGGAMIAALLLLALVRGTPWEQTRVYGLYERVLSLADPTGRQSYSSSDSFNKGDNNRFRWVWWRAVIDETVETNPVVGLGFGHDLARRFLREYYPEDTDDFSARSPHSILVTVFARMGGVGLAVLLIVLFTAGRQTWRALGNGSASTPYWCGAWVIFTSACFGVVLEGPMGAVVFWILLGLAQGTTIAEAATTASTDPAAPASLLDEPGAADSPAPPLPSPAPSVSRNAPP